MDALGFNTFEEQDKVLVGMSGGVDSSVTVRILQEQGFAVEMYRCSLDPGSCDMVLVRELSFCVFDSTAPHEYFPEREGDETIDIYRAAVRQGTDEKYAAELADVTERYRAIVRRATAQLSSAQRALEAFQRAKLPVFSAGTLAGQQERLAEILFED